ncbi:hypothetical protein MTBSS4_10180 [Magnetospirillum sp. SS-4]|nr:hypothetical protein MTBSS4_10180 [Magnetospirillum sp. SS-4]
MTDTLAPQVIVTCNIFLTPCPHEPYAFGGAIVSQLHLSAGTGTGREKEDKGVMSEVDTSLLRLFLRADDALQPAGG